MPQICHEHCPKPGGSWGWLVIIIAALVALGAGAKAAAPALGRLVHDALVWATVAMVAIPAALMLGYVAVCALRGRRSQAKGGDSACSPTATASRSQRSYPSSRRVNRG